MKKLLIFLVPIAFIIGCGTTPVEISAPTNLTITGADGLSVSFSWVESETPDIDGYIFFLNDSIGFDTVGTVSSATVQPPALGTITLRAYKGDDISPVSNAATLSVVTGGPDTIWYYDSPNPSGYGWDASGTGTVYSFQGQDSLNIDIYLDRDFDIASPSTYSKWLTTYITKVDSDVDVAPDAITSKAAPAEEGYFVVRLPNHGEDGGDQYVKLHVTSVNTTDSSIVFEYTFQPLENYRRFK